MLFFRIYLLMKLLTCKAAEKRLINEDKIQIHHFLVAVATRT